VAPAAGQIRFRPAQIPFTLENGETAAGPKYTPATMAGGLALFDCDGDGDLDLYFANGAELPSLKKTAPKYANRLFLNDGRGAFTDFTETAGLAGHGYDTGVATGDYDNDGWLDLFVVNYLRWAPDKEPVCPGYCHPKYYEGTPNSLWRNNRDGTFRDVSAATGIRRHVGKGMGVAVADYDLDGRLDLFVTNDKAYNFLFRNAGGRFEEKAFEAGVALAEHAMEISGMGADFRDFDNDGLPDIVLVALENETFPLYRNSGKGFFEEVTGRSGLAALSARMAGYGPGLFDFDNDGFKDLFVSRGHVQSLDMRHQWEIEQPNTVFRNLGGRKVAALTAEAGFDAAPPRRHRGAAFGDLNGDGRIDAVVSALMAPAQIWINESPAPHHWLLIRLEGTRSNRDGIGARIRVLTPAGSPYNHASPSTGYASTSAGPVHFGLGPASTADLVEIRWPSGRVQRLKGVKAGQVLYVKEPAEAP